MPTCSADPHPEPPRPAPYLAVDSLVTGYAGIPVVREVSLQAGPGEIVAVLGANGAGKSTLVKAVAGVIRAMSGQVLIDGANVTNLPTDVLTRQGLGYVPQSEDVFERLTVDENLELGGYTLARKAVPGRMEEVLALFPRLATMRRRAAGKLSGGERKMLAVARVMMLKPRVLILDEPTAGLTEGLAESFLSGHLRAIADAQCAVLIVEQRMQAALSVADWSYVLVAGATAASGPAASLRGEELGAILLQGRDQRG